MSRTIWYVNNAIRNEDVRHVNLILTVGREIEENSREKADRFSFSRRRGLKSWRVGALLRATLPRRGMRGAYANVKKKSVFWSVLHYPRQRHFRAFHGERLYRIDSPLVFLSGRISRGKYRMEWKNPRIAVRWLKDLRD